MDVLARKIIGVFAHVEGADADGSRELQPLDERRVAPGRRIVAVDLRAGPGRDARKVEQVLDREGHAGERAGVMASGSGGIDRIGFRQGASGRDVGKGPERAVPRRNAGERRLRGGACRQSAVAHGRRDGGGIA